MGALELGTLFSGAVLTEQVFSIPGFGKMIVDAVFNRDYPVVQGVVLVTAFLYVDAESAGGCAVRGDQSEVEGGMRIVMNPLPLAPSRKGRGEAFSRL